MSTSTSQCKLIYFDALLSNPDGVQAMRQRCSELFTHLPLVDFYFDDPDLAPLLILLLVAATAPLCFLYSATVARSFLAVEMKRMASLFRMSQSLAAVTLLAFAGAAPDIIAALSNNRHTESTTIIASMGMGVYFFGMTAITGVVSLLSPKPIRIPKEPLIKELVFSLVAVATVIAVGLVGEVGWPFVAWLALLLAAYLFASLYIESLTKAREFESSLNAVSKSIAQLQLSLPLEGSQEFPVVKDESERGEEPHRQRPFDALEVKDSGAEGGSHRSAQASEENEIAEISKSLAATQVNPSHSRISFSDALTLPLVSLQTLTIPHQGNPLRQTWLESAPVLVGCLLVQEIFIDSNLSFVTELVVAGAVAGAFALLSHFGRPSKFFQITQSALVVAVALAWIQFFISLVIDYLAFIIFYYSANDVILRSFLLASGTSVSELLGSQALASIGAEIMAVLSVYSGAFLNLVIVLLVNTLYHIKGEIKQFDIFGLKGRGLRGPFKAESLFAMGFAGLTVLVLFAHLAFFALHRFKTNRVFGGILVAGYSAAFLATIALGVN